MSALKIELETWAKYGCISRKKLSQARNAIDVKWVGCPRGSTNSRLGQRRGAPAAPRRPSVSFVLA
eukprot:4750759-Alexandrium_andersonii.AAC.1